MIHGRSFLRRRFIRAGFGIGVGYPYGYGLYGDGCLVPQTVFTSIGPQTLWVNVCDGTYDY